MSKVSSLTADVVDVFSSAFSATRWRFESMVSLMLLPSVASVEESVLLTAPYRSISTTRLPTRCVVQAESQSSMVFFHAIEADQIR